MTRQLWQRLKPLVPNTFHRGKQHRAALDADLVPTSSPTASFSNDTFTGDPQQFPFQPGHTILDRFRIIRPLGRGGMGEVYEAEDLQLGRIALKTIHHGIGLSASVSQQFRQEIQLARRVSGPQICRIHDLFELPPAAGRSATPFLTMEYLEGVTLSQKLRRDGPLPWKQALPVALEICAGLRLIHDSGIIHRDLKCANIMLCKQQDSTRVVLMDFGLASRFHSGGVFATATTLASSEASQGGIAGTPQYMAPEQFEGKPLTPAADIYALGVILYELVTGKHPFAADTPLGTAIRRAQHLEPPSSLGFHVPKHWDRIIARCLEFNPAHRFASATDVASALSVGPASLRNIRHDRPWALRFVAAALAVAAVWAAAAWWQTRQYYHPSAQAQGWYDKGVAAIHEGTYVKATRSLQEAVNQDPKFAMAHVRLAEAWENLDFETDAHEQMLLATAAEHTLAPLDHLYLDAVRLTISHDFPGAINRYQTILNKLPPQERSNGYVDLGKAYERAGDPTHALTSYAEASKQDTQSAAPCLRTAILQSRLNQGKPADVAFEHTEKLFRAESNQEALGELDFQRGYAYNDRSDPTHARVFLDKALSEAAALGSVQLEIRARTQLSAVLYTSGHASEGAEQARQAIQLARDNRIDSWAADGLGRLANAQIKENNLPEAERSAREALQVAVRSGQLRAQALANFTIASIMDGKHQPDEVIGPAEAALDYYRSHGFFKPAEYSALLLVRAQSYKGNYKEALQSGEASLEVATKSGDHRLQLLSNEAVGFVYLEKEDFVRALTYFEQSTSFAVTPENIERQSEHCADVLWQLGRYAEADRLLQLVPTDVDLQGSFVRVRLASLISRGRFHYAADLSRKQLTLLATLPEDRDDLRMEQALAEAHLEHPARALQLIEAPALIDAPPNAVWTNRLISAEVYLYSHKPKDAFDVAVEAAHYFEVTGKPVSELRSLWIADRAAKLMADSTWPDSSYKKELDIMEKLHQNWGTQAFQLFLLRPDMMAIVREKH